MSRNEKSWLVSAYLRDCRALHCLIRGTSNPIKRAIYERKMREIKADMRQLYNMEYRQYKTMPIKAVQVW